MMLGGISDLWQREIMGIGPTGRDKGKGGKFLLLPPDYDGAAPDGYMAAKSQTYGVVFGVRGFQSAGETAAGGRADEDDAGSILSRKRPARQPTSSSTARVRRSTRSSADSGQYFDDLAWMIEREPQDRIPSHERFQLAAIGIEKGKPFTPDAARRHSSTRRHGSRRRSRARTASHSDDPGAARLSRSQVGVGVHRRLRRLGLAGLRQHRPSRRLRLHRDRHVAGDGRETRRHRIAVSLDAA